MSFDFNSVMQDAQQSLAGGGSGDYKYKLVYPGQGTLTVKLLFNIKSNLVKRAVNRHEIGEDKIACMKTYGKECSICKIIEDIKNARAIDLSKMRSKVRGISLAQYVESSYRIDGVNLGDIILLMYPWTVYKDISGIVSQAKNETELSSLIASNNGYLFTITRDAANNYSTQVNPFKTYQSCQTDADFMNMLNGLDDLNGMILPTPITDELMKDVIDVTNELTNLYMVQRSPQYQQPAGQQMPMSFGNFGQPMGQPMNQPMGGFQSPMNGQPMNQPMGQPIGGFQNPGISSAPPITPPFGQPMNQPMGQGQPPINPPFGTPSVNPPFNIPFGQSVGQPMNTPFGQPAGQPMNTPFGQPMNQPMGQPANQPATTFNQPVQPTGQPNAPFNNPQFNNPTVPPQVPLVPPQTTDPSKPPCFGRHGQEDINKCLLCPSEIACSQVR